MTDKRGINSEKRTWREIICSSEDYKLKFPRAAEVRLLEKPLKKKDQVNSKRVSEVEVMHLQYFTIGTIDLRHRETKGKLKNIRILSFILVFSPFSHFPLFSH